MLLHCQFSDDHSFLKDSVSWKFQEMKIQAQNRIHWAHRDCGAPNHREECVKRKAHIPQDLNETNFSTVINNSGKQEHSLHFFLLCVASNFY